MKIERVRKDMVARFTELEPELSPEVLDDATYQSVYKTPFRARNMRALTKYEEKRSYQFCIACISHDDETDKVIAYRAYITEDDNLLENKRNSWIRMQCFRCGFDLRFDKPAPKQSSATDEQLRQIQEMMRMQPKEYMNSQQLHELQQHAQRQMAKQSGLASAYGNSRGQFGQGLLGGASAAEIEHRQRELNERMRHMVDSASYQAFPPTILKPDRFGATSAPPPKKNLVHGVDIDEEIFKRMRKG